MAGLLMMLSRSSFFSALGLVIVFKVFKVSLVEANMEARGICILSTFTSGLVENPLKPILFFKKISAVTWRPEKQGAMPR